MSHIRLRTNVPRLLLATLAFVAVAALGFARGVSAQEPGQPGYTGPRLEIAIPGVEFSGIIRDNDYITVPWLGQYIGGVYTFLISIVGMFAATVMIFGGFQYAASAGDKGKIAAAKKKMTNAFMGLILVFGSYTILYAINPGLTRFEGLRLENVKTDPIMESLMTTSADTAAPPSSGANSSAPPASSSGAPSSPDGPFTGTIYKTCPLTLADNSMKGIPDFMNKIRAGMGTIVDAKTPMDRVVQIGNIASACDMHLGNCGKSVGTFYALAGVLNDPKCNQNSTTNEHCNSWPDRVHSVPDTRFVWWARCDNEQAIDFKDEPACTSPGVWPRLPKGKETPKNCNGQCLCTRSDCVTGNFAATAKVGKDLLAFAKTQPKMAGWPDSWVKGLKRGDWVIMYNGNDDKTGGHSAMFVGWADKDHIITLNGSAKSGIHYSKQCVTSGCFNKPLGWGMWQPVTRILRQKGY